MLASRRPSKVLEKGCCEDDWKCLRGSISAEEVMELVMLYECSLRKDSTERTDRLSFISRKTQSI